MARALPWLNRLQRTFSREATFLPKRLVLVTLLLLVIYLGLLIRTDQQIRHSALGFVEANLQSKLVADYEQAAKPPAPLAPLRLEILRAKLQDENPTWSATEVEAALQRALAAAAAPILQATPTPYPTTRMIVQAENLVNDQRRFDTLASADPIDHKRKERTPAAETVAVLARWPVHAVGTQATTSAVAFAIDRPTNEPPHQQSVAPVIPSATTPTVITLLVSAPTPVQMAPPNTATRVAPNNPTLPGEEMLNLPSITAPITPPITPTSLPTANSTPTTMPVTHLAASYPNDGESIHPIPTPTATDLWKPPMSATRTATWTPLPTPTSTASATLPAESNEASPIVATIVATIAATATPLFLAPLIPTAGPVSTPEPPPSMTPLPSPTVAVSPTTVATVATDAPTITPTITPIPTLLPTIHGLTAQAAEDKVVLAWEAAGGPMVGYHLYRGESPTSPPGERRNATPLVNATFVDTVILDGRRYFYYVTVVDQQNRESLPSPAVAVTVADRTPPHTPHLLSLHLSGNQLQIRWQANSEADLAGYRLYRSTSWPVDYAHGPVHGATLLTTPGYLDQVVLNGQTYYYLFTAVDQAGNESRPSIDAQMPTIDLTAPAAPVGLAATTQPGGVDLTWRANSESDLAGYRLYRSATLPVDTNGPPLHSQPLLTMPSYSDPTVETGKSYYYVVVAVDANQNGSSASEAALITVK